MSNVIFGKKFRFIVNSSLNEYKNFQQIIASVDFELVDEFRKHCDLVSGPGILEINFYQVFSIENINSPLCDRLPPRFPAIATPIIQDILLAPKLDEWICKDHKKDFLRFQMLDEHGNVIEEIKFSGLEVVSDKSSFNYAESAESLRKVKLIFKEHKKTFPPIWSDN